MATTFTGGPGDDTYDVTASDDAIVEQPDGGMDIVRASVDYALPDNVENLTLLGGALAGTGNALANTITGNALDNTLRGGGGADHLSGLEGDDLFLATGADFVAGGTIDGGVGTDLLRIEGYASADLTGITLTSLEGVDATGAVRMTAAQVSALDALHASSLEIASAGDADLTGLDLLVGDLALGDAGVRLITGDPTRVLNVRGVAGAQVSLSDGTFVTFTDTVKTATIGSSGDDYFLGAIGSVFDAGAGYDVVELAGIRGNYDLRHQVWRNVEELRGGLSTVTLDADQFNQLQRSAGLVFYRVSGSGTLHAVSGLGYATLLNGGMTLDWGASDVNVSIQGSNGVDKVTVGKFGSTVNGNDGDDVIVGGAGIDYLSGGAGTDRILGGAGNDQLAGGAGIDQVYGGAGDDVLILSTEGLGAGEVVSGGAGHDTLRLVGTGNALTEIDLTRVQIAGMEALSPDFRVRISVGQLAQFDTFNVGKLTVKGAAPLDLGHATGYIGWIVLETPGARLSLTGFAGKTAVTGSEGADTIHAADGGSELKGGGGNDWLWSGIGADTLRGGAGRDRFVFATDPSGAIDRIADFVAVDDSVMLDHGVFTALPVTHGAIGRAAFWIGAQAHDASDRIVYDAGTGALYYDADGNGAGAQVQFAHLSANLALTHGDFIVI